MAAPQQLSNEQLQLLQLCFSEHEFGASDVLRLFDAPQAAPQAETLGSADGGESAVVDDAKAMLLEFDPVQFIDDKIEQGISLETVCTDLATFEKFLQNRILQHVHEDVYEAFVSVSGELVGVDEQLLRVHQPLIATKTRLEAALSQLSMAEGVVLEMLRNAEHHELRRQFHLGCTQALVQYDALCDATDVLERSEYFLSLSRGSSSSSSVPGGTVVSQQLPSDRDISALRQILSDLVDFENALRNLSPPPPPPQEMVQTHDNKQKSTAAAYQAEVDELNALALSAHQHIITILNNTFTSVHAVYVSHKLSSSTAGGGQGFVLQRILDVMGSLMEAYATIGVDDFTLLYRDHIVRSFVENILSWKAAAAARASPDSGASLLTELRNSLEHVLFPLIPRMRDVFGSAASSLHTAPSSPVATRSHSQSLADLDSSASASSPPVPGALPVPSRHLLFISQVYWPAICNTVVTRMVFLFLPGIAATFHKHFSAAHHLVMLLEAHCGSVAELQALRSSPEMTLWSHKWNVDVYHTLRATEAKDTQVNALKSLQALLPSNSGSQPLTNAILRSLEKTSGEFPVALQATSEIARIALWFFDDDVFLFPLSHKLLRDAILMIRRYVQLATAISIAQMKGLETSGGSGSGAAVSECTIAFIGFVLRDLEWLGSHFVPDTLRLVVERASREDSTTCAPLSTILLRCREMVQKDGALAVRQAVIESLTNQCAAVLQNIRTIKATYSHTKKPMPSSPSWFVASILDALVKFKAGAKSGLSEVLVQQVCSAVIDDISAKFRDLAKETIVSARKTEESLGKLRRKREEARLGGAGAPSASSTADLTSGAGAQASRVNGEGATDRDKMVVQLYLDAHEYGSLLRPFNVHKERYAPLQSILKLCRRAEWLLAGDDTPEPAEVEDDE